MARSMISLGLGLLLWGLPISATASGQDTIKVTILYDNYPFNPSTTPDWGFSCFVEASHKVLLFDAGASGSILSANANALGVDLNRIDLAVFSHDHSDHTGGMRAGLVAGSKVTAHFGRAFSEMTEQAIRSTGATAVRSSGPVTLLPTIQTTGEVSGSPTEQALIISTDSGLVVITGCSHPGVIPILQRVKQRLSRDIYLVIGGFHWLNYSGMQVAAFIQSMKEMGVKKCGASHCTGARAIQLIREAYGPDFVDLGVGRVLTFLSTSAGAKNNDR